MGMKVGTKIPAAQRDGDNMIDLSGKVAAVRGAADRIGAAVARSLASAGAHVALGDVQAERGEQVATQIREAGGQVSDREALKIMLRHPQFVAAITAFTPMGRVADANEIIGTAPYLASNASSFTTGPMPVIDGGCLAK
jgi:NAD(P)-dependent dehydrogenase (short-subunit alcohol dehydrogenase family)